MSADAKGGRGFWTIPNILCLVRITGSGPLLWAAHEGERGLFLGILIFLLATDWADGKLAIALDQETTVGARLDSAADALMYAAVGLSFWWLEEEVIRREFWWFTAVLVTWLLSGAVSLIRFGRLPSYHNVLAKLSWLVVAVVTLTWLLTGWADAVPWALALVILTNLEAAAIGLALPEWTANVRSLGHALMLRSERPGRR